MSRRDPHDHSRAESLRLPVRPSRRRTLSLDGLEERTVLSHVLPAAIPHVPASGITPQTTALVNQLVQQVAAAVPNVPGASTALTAVLTDQIEGPNGSLLQPLIAIPYGTNTATAAGADALFTEAANNAINATQLAANEMLTEYVDAIVATGQAKYGTDGVIAYRGQQFTLSSVRSELNQAFNTVRTDFSGAQATLLAGGGASSTGAVIESPTDLSNYTNLLISQLIPQVQSALAPLPGASFALTPNVLQTINGPSSASLQSLLDAIPYTPGPNGQVNALGVQSIDALEAAIALNSTQLAENEILTVAADTLISSGAATLTPDGAIRIDGRTFNLAAVQRRLNDAFQTFRVSYFAEQAHFLASSASPARG